MKSVSKQADNHLKRNIKLRIEEYAFDLSSVNYLSSSIHIVTFRMIGGGSSRFSGLWWWIDSEDQELWKVRYELKIVDCEG
jgi:hypothetical protein